MFRPQLGPKRLGRRPVTACCAGFFCSPTRPTLHVYPHFLFPGRHLDKLDLGLCCLPEFLGSCKGRGGQRQVRGKVAKQARLLPGHPLRLSSGDSLPAPLQPLGADSSQLSQPRVPYQPGSISYQPHFCRRPLIKSPHAAA